MSSESVIPTVEEESNRSINQTLQKNLSKNQIGKIKLKSYLVTVIVAPSSAPGAATVTLLSVALVTTV